MLTAIVMVLLGAFGVPLLLKKINASWRYN